MGLIRLLQDIKQKREARREKLRQAEASRKSEAAQKPTTHSEGGVLLLVALLAMVIVIARDGGSSAPSAAERLDAVRGVLDREKPIIDAAQMVMKDRFRALNESYGELGAAIDALIEMDAQHPLGMSGTALDEHDTECVRLQPRIAMHNREVLAFEKLSTENHDRIDRYNEIVAEARKLMVSTAGKYTPVDSLDFPEPIVASWPALPRPQEFRAHDGTISGGGQSYFVLPMPRTVSRPPLMGAYSQPKSN